MERNRIVIELFLDKPNFREVSGVAGILKSGGINSITMPPEDRSINTHLIIEVSDAKKAADILNKQHIRHTQKDVLLIILTNKPGTMAEVSLKIAKKGINLLYAFSVTMTNEYSYILLGTADNENALIALGE